MTSWLRRFLHSDNPEVRVAAGLIEPEAHMWRELLVNNGIPAYVKNVGGGALYEVWRPTTGRPDFDLIVRRTDLERAREILEPLLEPAQLVENEEAPEA
jgi:hypothetical protein